MNLVRDATWCWILLYLCESLISTYSCPHLVPSEAAAFDWTKTLHSHNMYFAWMYILFISHALSNQSVCNKALSSPRKGGGAAVVFLKTAVWDCWYNPRAAAWCCTPAGRSAPCAVGIESRTQPPRETMTYKMRQASTEHFMLIPHNLLLQLHAWLLLCLELSPVLLHV